MSSKAIQIHELAKDYQQYSKPSDRLKQLLFGKRRQYFKNFHALKPISIDIKHGEVIGLVGQNGAGKSTLLQLISGTLNASSGSVHINGRIAALLELGSGFNPEFTGRENVFLNASVLGLTEKEIEEKFDSIVDFSGVGDFIDQPVKTYSSGMMVRLAFSVATSVEPDILIIDEALSVGDGAFARKSFDRIMELKDRGCTIIFCSHSLYQIEILCDRVVWLRKGEMVAVGTPDIVVPDYQSFLDSVSAVSNTQVTKELVSHHVSGSARIKLATVSIDGRTEQPLMARSLESQLSVSCQFEYDIKLPVPGVAVTISTQDGRIVGSVGTWNDQVEPKPISNGVAECHVDFPKIPMLKGMYRVGVYLYCEKGIHNYEWADPVSEFRVIQSDNEQGLIRLPHIWR
jgi:lipopolysaccharide transport system ATP-binding protein